VFFVSFVVDFPGRINMPFRVTDGVLSAKLTAQITASHQRIAAAQEQIATGKRINRPSDDPSGAEVVLRLRTSQAVVEQFRRNAGAAQDALLTADGALDVYQRTLDRARTLLSQGATDSTTLAGKQAIAAEIDGIRERLLSLANTRYDEGYLFGGTRQSAPPFDAAGTPAATPALPQLIQIDPDGSPVTTGVAAESVFTDAGGTVFEALTAAATALRGTGNPAADQAAVLAQIDRLTAFTDLGGVARTTIGASLGRVEAANERLNQSSLSLEEAAQRLEAADFAEAAVKLTESGRALDAIIQTAAQIGRRSLIDLIG
jgi:flagellar hook-associated protein 3 FlgL